MIAMIQFHDLGDVPDPRWYRELFPGSRCYARVYLDRFLLGERHEHPCPICYENKPCWWDCSNETDFTRMEGQPFGSYAVCDDCLEGRRRGT